MSTVIVRKKLRKLEDLDEAERYTIIKEYKENTSLSKIAAEHNMDRKAIENFINKEYKDFLLSKETHHLWSGHQLYDNLKRPKDINEEFLAMLEEGAGLTYAYLLRLMIIGLPLNPQV